MCSRTQYKHNVHAAAQCVEVSWTSAFLLPRALTDVLFLLFVPSALRGVQHVTICTFQFCKKAGTCPLVLGPKNWDGLGSAGGGLPSTRRQEARNPSSSSGGGRGGGGGGSSGSRLLADSWHWRSRSLRSARTAPALRTSRRPASTARVCPRPPPHHRSNSPNKPRKRRPNLRQDDKLPAGGGSTPHSACAHVFVCKAQRFRHCEIQTLFWGFRTFLSEKWPRFRRGTIPRFCVEGAF